VVRDYPEKPPLCFVRPTRGMEIRPRHKHVDSAGQCYTPYLSSWQPARSDLLGLVTDLQAIFSTDPPVYAKPPASSEPSPPGTATKSPTTPPPAYPPVQRPSPVSHPHLPPAGATFPPHHPQHPPVFGIPGGQPAHGVIGYNQQHQQPPVSGPESRRRELEERMARKASDVWQAVSADVGQFHLVQQRLRDGSSWLQHSLTTLLHDKVLPHYI
jgi:hypothetical protein